MKKIIIPVFLCFIFCFLGSCSKQTEKIGTDQLVEEVLNLESEESQKIVFSEVMSPYQKNLLWQRRLNDLLLKHEFTSSQKGLLSELKLKLTADAFKSETGRDKFMKEFGFLWEQKAVTAFGYDECYKYFVTLSKIDHQSESYELSNTEEEEDVDNGLLKTCNCNKTSSVSCLGRNECTNPFCEKTISGCGWFLLYECNGRCQL